jgi:uncharacterized caspase-like protein
MQAPEGTLISYATQPGSVAQDGSDGNSPYTKALVQSIKQPGLDIFRTFNQVGVAVKQATGGSQQPWVSLSPITGDFYFVDAAAAPAPPAASSEATQIWAATKDTTNVALLEAFVERYRDTFYANLARSRIVDLKAQAAQQQVAVAAPSATAPIPPRLATTQSGKRVALVIGNAAYQNAPKLSTPVHDATAIADVFKTAGFDSVQLVRDGGNLDLKRALRTFTDAAADADFAIVYFAGYGIAINRVNYLLPVDVKLASERDADDESVSLDRVMASVQRTKRLGLVLIDASRDNPFSRTMKRSRPSRPGDIITGLAAVIPAVNNTLIAFAAKAGSIARDGDGDLSPYATAIVERIVTPGVDASILLMRIREDVLAATGNRQEPFFYGSLISGVTAIVDDSR